MILVMLTPVLGNLTATVSDNSIILFYSRKCTLSNDLVCVFVHLIQYDFQMIINKPERQESIDQIALSNKLKGVAEPSKEETKAEPPKKKETAQNLNKVFSPTSINAIFFASILLSSRLNNNTKVFTLLFISLCLFGFVPIIRHLMRHRVRFFYDVNAVILSIFLCYSIMRVNRFFGICYALLILFISFISPLIFIYAYTFKNDIRGPWDCPQIKQYHCL